MIRKLISKLQDEPILIIGVAIIALQAFQQAMQGGLSLEDALVAVVTAVLTWLGRQLVYPASHVDAAEAALLEAKVDEPLGEPFPPTDV